MDIKWKPSSKSQIFKQDGSLDSKSVNYKVYKWRVYLSLVPNIIFIMMINFSAGFFILFYAAFYDDSSFVLPQTENSVFLSW